MKNPNSPHGGGIRTDGIKTVDDLMSRCVVDDITGCWLLNGKSGNAQRNVWFPQAGRWVSLGVLACYFKTGKPPKKGDVWHCKCETKGCANPAHRMRGDRSSQMKNAGIKLTPVRRANLIKARRSVSKLTDEQCAEIRASTDKLTEIAEKYGISPGYASVIRRGVFRRPVSASGSSVFSFAASIGGHV